MLRVRSLLIGILLVALAIGFTGGLRGVNTVTQASELDFCKLFGTIAPAVVAVATFEGEEFKGHGSGFIIDRANGYVVTNWHVIDTAVLEPDRYRNVVLLPEKPDVDNWCASGGDINLIPDGKPATVVRVDAPHDLALLSIGTVDRQVWLGDSGRVNVGDNAFVIGYPGPLGTLTITQDQIADFHQSYEYYEEIVVNGKSYALLRVPAYGGRVLGYSKEEGIVQLWPLIWDVVDWTIADIDKDVELTLSIMDITDFTFPDKVYSVLLNHLVITKAHLYPIVAWESQAISFDGSVIRIRAVEVEEWVLGIGLATRKPISAEMLLGLLPEEWRNEILPELRRILNKVLEALADRKIEEAVEVLQEAAPLFKEPLVTVLQKRELFDPTVQNFLRDVLVERFAFKDTVTIQSLAPAPEEEVEVTHEVSPITRDFIQTRYAIAHGNSGGPIFNNWGQVIGVVAWLERPGYHEAELSITSKQVIDALKLEE
jgi:S1-C subfamily serine protease